VPARVLVTTRAGGRSAPPYDANNLALHVGDDPAAVTANRRRLAGQLGVDRVRFMQQVHGAAVAIAEPADAEDPAEDVAGADVLVSAAPGVAVAVLVADCVPVALAGESAVAVVHAGRRGIAGGVVVAAVAALGDLGAGRLVATIGPAICGRCYEVPADMQRDVVAAVPEAEATTDAGTPGLDLPAAVRSQLLVAGVEVRDQPPICTREDGRFYSYRRDGVTGRFAMVAMLSR
jgi:YfiH family protein